MLSGEPLLEACRHILAQHMCVRTRTHIRAEMQLAGHSAEMKTTAPAPACASRRLRLLEGNGADLCALPPVGAPHHHHRRSGGIARRYLHVHHHRTVRIPLCACMHWRRALIAQTHACCALRCVCMRQALCVSCCVHRWDQKCVQTMAASLSGLHFHIRPP